MEFSTTDVGYDMDVSIGSTIGSSIPVWFTMGPAYKEFGYYEHPHITSKYFLRKEFFWFILMFEKFSYNEYCL